MNNKEAAKLYDLLYKESPVGKGMYGGSPRRDGLFMNFLVEHVPISKKSKILDAGCGRGTLVRLLRSYGYSVEGTEIADSLLKRGGELYGLGIKKLFYSELGKLKTSSFDVVISNDVVEHLEDNTAVAAALHHLGRITKKYLLMSTGGERAAYCPLKRLEIRDLHTVKGPRVFWERLFIGSSGCKIVDSFPAAGSLFIFGVKGSSE